ncbi:MAG: hypothetical protein IPH93_16560 [Saprospiraceae bacterium]|nr:hypothetical protein [Saprospiraceae bacterium]
MLLSCNGNEITQSITFIPDLTEDYFTGFTGKDIRKMSSITSNSNNGENLRIVPVTDIGFNQSFELQLPKIDNILMSNNYNRVYETSDYFKQVDSVLLKFMTDTITRNSSVIFKILSEELNSLSESLSDRKLLVTNTDFMEKSFINFYETGSLQFIQEKPKALDSILLQKYPLNDLSGIEVIFVYLPLNRIDSERCEIISGFYKRLLESKNARVKIVGSL